MKVDDFGVWEITLPAKDGVSVIPHGSKVKVRTLVSAFCRSLLTEQPDYHGHPRR